MIDPAKFTPRQISCHIDRLEQALQRANVSLSNMGMPGVALPKLPNRRR